MNSVIIVIATYKLLREFMPVRSTIAPVKLLLDKDLEAFCCKPLLVECKKNLSETSFKALTSMSIFSAYSSLTFVRLLRFEGRGPLNEFLSKRL